MSLSIPNSFVRQYEKEVHVAYQQTGSQLRNTVRNKNSIVGKSTTFQKVGKGVAGTKTRHGKVPVMNIDHEPVECILQDWYAGDYVDALDELKTHVNERQVTQDAASYALGRKTDELILEALQANTSITKIADGSTIMTKKIGQLGLELFGNNRVPVGDRVAFVGWRQWGELLDIDEFANSDFVGPDGLPWKVGGAQGKVWLGTLWMPTDILPFDAATGKRTCYWWHKTAIGHASGKDVSVQISWENTSAAYFVNANMSQGACVIDPMGIISFDCDES